MPPIRHALVLVAILLPGAASGRPPELDSLLHAHPADRLVAPLRSFESVHGRVPGGAEAALLLGRLHYARGEYRPAADAFARAAARLDPERKAEARYWAGLAWLALREPQQARAALEEVTQSASIWRSEARLGIALAWEMLQRPDRAWDELERLLAENPGEAGPAALERQVALAERLHRPQAAQRARTRLMRDYPASIEAARAASPHPALAPVPPGAMMAVQIGEFTREGRARTLAAAARRAGFSSAQVITRGEGKGRSHAVRLGLYSTLAEARKAGAEAEHKLGVSYRVVSAP